MAGRNIETATRTALEQQRAHTFRAVHIQLSDNRTEDILLWSGEGDLIFGGHTYIGMEGYGSIERIQETNELKANGLRLQLLNLPVKSVTPAMRLSVLSTNKPYQGKLCRVYLGVVNEAGQTIGTPIRIFTGYNDQMTLTDGDTVGITLTAESRLIDFERPRLRTYTSGWQKALYPGDKFFDEVPSIQGKIIRQR